MRGLTIVVASADAARLRSAFGMALAQVALGGEARLFLDGGAVALLASPIAATDDTRHAAAGLPTLAELLDEARAAGVGILLCQSGMALAGLAPEDLPAGMEFGGMTGLMATMGEDRLVVA